MKNGRQWRLNLRRVAYHAGVTMGGSVYNIFNLQPVTDQYLKTKIEENHPFWTKLYAKPLKELEIERCHQYPNAGAMLMLMKVITPREEVKHTIKILHSKVGCFTDENTKVKIGGGTGSFDHDELSGQISGGGQNTMISLTLITPPKPQPLKGSLQLHLDFRMRWPCNVVEPFRSRANRIWISSIPNKVHDFLDSSIRLGTNVSSATVHIWLCMRCMYPAVGLSI